jgi:predicted esterase
MLLALLLAATFVERQPTTSDPSITYAYVLPPGYTAEKKWPVLFVFDPGKRGAMAAELFRDAAETYGWIVVSSNDTSSAAEWPPNAKAINATTADAGQRFSIDRNRVYAAGMSGGAIMAWRLGRAGGGVAGVIGCSGRPTDDDPRAPSFDWFGTAGLDDFNYTETRAIEASLAAAHAHYRVEVFDGTHSWPPKELLRQAIEWMELQAMRRGTRPRDDAFIARTLQADMAAAASLDGLEAFRRYEAIARTYDGLANVGAARAKADALRRNVQRALNDEQREAEFEAAAKQRVMRAVREFVADDTEQGAAFARALDVDHLRKMGTHAAKRVLAFTRFQLRTLARELDAQQRAMRAGVVRSIADSL